LSGDEYERVYEALQRGAKDRKELEREKMMVLRLRLIYLALFMAFVDGERRDNKRDLYGKQQEVQYESKNKRAYRQNRKLKQATDPWQSNAEDDKRVDCVHNVRFVNIFHTRSIT
jgi:hypothetical protein